MKKIVFVSLAVMLVAIGSAWAISDNAIMVKKKYGSECTITERCDDMIYIDCGAAVDGPAYYLDSALEVIGTSGGLCMRGCTGAPDVWKQCVKRNSASPSQPEN